MRTKRTFCVREGAFLCERNNAQGSSDPFLNNGEQWLPGKGISIPVEQFDKVMTLLSQI